MWTAYGGGGVVIQTNVDITESSLLSENQCGLERTGAV